MKMFYDSKIGDIVTIRFKVVEFTGVKGCEECMFASTLCNKTACYSDDRADGKNVIFEIVEEK